MTSNKKNLFISLRFSETLKTSEFWCAAGLLALGVFMASRRGHWCQLRAYAVVLVACGSYWLRAKDLRSREVARIHVHTNVYCVGCRNTVMASLGVSPQLTPEESWYDAIYARRPAHWLALALWVAWLCHGAVFHEGDHASDEDSLLAQHATHSVLGWRTWLVWLQFLAALVSFGVRRGDLALSRWMAFTALMALSAHPRSVAAKLGALELASQTVLFFALFQLSEALLRCERYTAVTRRLDNHGTCIFHAALMALGMSPRRLFSAQVPPQFGLVHEQNADARSFESGLRSAWLLLAGPGLGSSLAVVQVLILTYLVRKQWSALGDAEKINLESGVAVKGALLVRIDDRERFDQMKGDEHAVSSIANAEVATVRTRYPTPDNSEISTSTKSSKRTKKSKKKRGVEGASSSSVESTASESSRKIKRR